MKNNNNNNVFFEQLLKEDDDGYKILIAGKSNHDWFDYEKALDAFLNLQYPQRAAEYIVTASQYWPVFNYKKAQNIISVLAKKYSTNLLNVEYYIVYAGIHWPVFDYNQGINDLLFLDNVNSVVNALLEWNRWENPPVQKIIDSVLNRAHYLSDSNIEYIIIKGNATMYKLLHVPTNIERTILSIYRLFVDKKIQKENKKYAFDFIKRYNKSLYIKLKVNFGGSV